MNTQFSAVTNDAAKSIDRNLEHNISTEGPMFNTGDTTSAIKADNYRYELEDLKKFKKFMVQGTISKRGLVYVDSDFGGYTDKTLLLTDVKIILRSSKDNKLKVVKKLDHIWLREHQEVIVNDRNIEIGDTIRYYGSVKEYKYSHGAIQLGIKQENKCHKNITQGYSFSR